MKILILSFAFIVPNLLFGQYNYMALTFGFSHPVGSYAASNNLQSEGFAINGLTANYSGAYYFLHRFGIAGDVKFTSNGINNTKVQNLLRQEVPLEITSDTTISYQLGYWTHVSFLAGPQFTLSIDKFDADFYAMAGLSVIMPPSMGINVTIGDQSFKRTSYPQYARFGVDIGAGLRYKLNDNYGIRIFASYFQSSAKSKIQDELTIDSKEISIKSYSTRVYSINFGFGIVYVLNNNQNEIIDKSVPY